MRAPRCRPVRENKTRRAGPRTTRHIEIVREGAQDQLLLDALVAHPIRLDAQRAIPTGQPVPSRANVIHALVPLVIFLCVIWAVPVRDVRERLWQLALALPVVLGVLALTTPFQLVGLIEMAIQQQAQQLGIERAPPFALLWMAALESGGRWVLPIAAALLNVMFVARCMPAQTLARSGR